MYIITLHTPDGMLTYTFQNTSTGKTGDDQIGIHTFIKAMKLMFQNHCLYAYLRIMDDRGRWYYPESNNFFPKCDPHKTMIKLNDKPQSIGCMVMEEPSE